MLDELNSFIGLLRTEVKDNAFLEDIQWNLFNAGAMVINDNDSSLESVKEEDVLELEKAMDRMNEELPDLKNFIIPNGTKDVSYAHICRTICRRAEVEVLNCLDMSNTERIAPITKYLNRLSDYFFVLARYLGYKEDVSETLWKT